MKKQPITVHSNWRSSQLMAWHAQGKNTTPTPNCKEYQEPTEDKKEKK